MLPRSRSGALVAALVLGWGILGVVDAAAAPPLNDDFGDAESIDALPFEHQTDTRDATTESTDPKCKSRNHTVWYSLMATEAGWLVGTTAGSDFDTTLSVYTGSRQNLTRLECDNDSGLGRTSHVRFKAAVGQTYHIMVSSSEGKSGGNLLLRVTGYAARCFGIAPTIIGTPGDDFIEGTRKGRDVIAGLEGNDTIVGNRFDLLCGNEGNDTVGGSRQSRGDDGNDSLTANRISSRLWGDNGNDILLGGFGHDDLTGGPGDDVIRGNEGFDDLSDSEGSNQLYGGANVDEISPGRGTGVVVGGAGYDTLWADGFNIDGVAVDMAAGTILVEGTFAQTIDGIETVNGSDGSDTFMGSDGNDEFFGQLGNDIIVGLLGDDELGGGDGVDSISGSEGDDYLLGDRGKDMLDGGDGSDGLDGGANNDSCINGERIIHCE